MAFFLSQHYTYLPVCVLCLSRSAASSRSIYTSRSSAETVAYIFRAFKLMWRFFQVNTTHTVNTHSFRNFLGLLWLFQFLPLKWKRALQSWSFATPLIPSTPKFHYEFWLTRTAKWACFYCTFQPVCSVSPGQQRLVVVCNRPGHPPSPSWLLKIAAPSGWGEVSVL
jgi:hypothetical protein